jgi:hypothetical protein
VPRASNKLEDFPEFEPLPKKVIAEKALNLRKWIWDNETDIPKDRLAVSNECIIDIIDMVEKRRVYFHIFHGIEMSEWNEAALYCFWILKLQPFSEVSRNNIPARQSNEVNASIAIRLMRLAIVRIKEDTKSKKLNKGNIFSNIKHAFRYRDMSKEAVMALFECMLD